MVDDAYPELLALAKRNLLKSDVIDMVEKFDYRKIKKNLILKYEKYLTNLISRSNLVERIGLAFVALLTWAACVIECKKVLDYGNFGILDLLNEHINSLEEKISIKKVRV